MKLLIIDDEELLCEQLACIIKALPWHWEQIFTCTNALDALDTANRYNPEIVFTDICMPQKDGLELTRCIHEKNPETIVIIITGFSDFDYAQTGIKYHVFDYILKPVDPDLIAGTLKKALRQLNEKQSQQNLHTIMKQYFTENRALLLQSFLEAVLFHPESLSPTQLEQQASSFSLSFENYILTAVRCTSVSPFNTAEDYYTIRLIEDILKKHTASSIIHLWGSTLYWFMTAKKQEELSVQSITSQILKLQNQIESILPISLQFAISRPGHHISQAPSLRRQTEICFEFQEQWNDTSFLFFNDIPIPSKETWTGQDYIRQLCIQLRCGHEERIPNIITCLIHSLKNSPLSLKLTIPDLICAQIAVTFSEMSYDYSHVSFKRIKEKLNYCIQYNAVPCAQFDQLIGILSEICRSVTKRLHQSNDYIIKKIQDYINENYKDQIGLTDAAEVVYRSPSYVSRLMKQFTGKSFTQTLTEKRLDEAKHLLKDTSMPISSIALTVGYPNAKYFSRLFNDHIGMTPNDYRKLTQTLF